MSKIITLIALFLLLIGKSIAAEQIGLITDPFFTRGDTIVTIRTIIGHQNSYMALVDASSEHRSETLSIAPFIKTSFVNNDESLSSRFNVHATIVCGTKHLEKESFFGEPIPYTFMREYEAEVAPPTLERPSRICVFKEYQRPDNSIYRFMGEPKFILDMIEESVSLGILSVCEKEWHILSQFQRKLRHQRHLYSGTEVFSVLRKTPIGGGDTIVIRKTSIRKELRHYSNEPDVPECGSLGRGVPGNYTVI